MALTLIGLAVGIVLLGAIRLLRGPFPWLFVAIWLGLFLPVWWTGDKLVFRV